MLNFNINSQHVDRLTLKRSGSLKEPLLFFKIENCYLLQTSLYSGLRSNSFFANGQSGMIVFFSARAFSTPFAH